MGWIAPRQFKWVKFAVVVLDLGVDKVAIKEGDNYHACLFF